MRWPLTTQVSSHPNLFRTLKSHLRSLTSYGSFGGIEPQLLTISVGRVSLPLIGVLYAPQMGSLQATFLCIVQLQASFSPICSIDLELLGCTLARQRPFWIAGSFNCLEILTSWAPQFGVWFHRQSTRSFGRSAISKSLKKPLILFASLWILCSQRSLCGWPQLCPTFPHLNHGYLIGMVLFLDSNWRCYPFCHSYLYVLAFHCSCWLL